MTHIHVTKNYGGRITDERRILPGLYALDDERLFGAGQYLVENGHAVMVADPSAVTVPPVSAEPVVEESIGFSVIEPEAVEGVEEDPEVVGTGVMMHNGELINRPLGASAFEASEEVTDEPEAPKSRRK